MSGAPPGVKGTNGIGNRMLRSVFLSIVATAALGSAAVQDPASEAPALRFSVNVDLVALPVTVRDAKGRTVSDLSQQDFEVFEGGVRQSIRVFRHEDIPVTVGLVIDHSSSMRPKMGEVVEAARTFVRESNPEDEMFVVNFNEHVRAGLPDAVPFTNRADRLESAILRAPFDGQTALYDAMFDALQRAGAGRREKKALILISDGGDDASTHTLDDVLKLAARSTAVIYSIGIYDLDDPDRNPDVLRRLARATGGEAFFPKAADGIVATCESIARDLRSQYLIGYVPTPAARHAGYRAIRVTAHAAGKEKLSVRTRAGYFAAGDSAPVKDQSPR
jgi:Ca-activated chloride channel homolog